MDAGARKSWSFGSRILLPIVTVGLLAVALMAFGLYWAASRSDAVSVERQVRTTKRAIDNVTARLAQEQEVIAVWDESVVRTAGGAPDLAWIHENVGSWLHKIYGHDQTYILDAEDRVVYAGVDGGAVPTSLFESIRGDLRHMIDIVRERVAEPNGPFDRHPGFPDPGQLALTTRDAVHDTGLVNVGGRPAAASVMRIVPHTSRPSRAGRESLVISLRFLDRALLAELQHRDLIDSPRFSRSAVAGAGEQALPLTVPGGTQVGYLLWRPELPGTSILEVLLPITLVVALAVIGLMALLGWRLRRSTAALEHTMVQLRASEAQAQHLAFYDPLTGLPNRILFQERFEQVLAQVRREGGLALLQLDLDRFKRVNDTLGHQAGDALIREFASRVAQLVRGGDTLARLGGDEFVVLLPGVTRIEDAEALSRRILAATQAPFDALGNAAFVGVSIGIVMAPEAGLDRVDLMRKADIALYRAKAQGRGCFQLFTPSLDERIRFRSRIEEDLREALATGAGLDVHYQPEMADAGRSVVGLEALVRWTHPDRGRIPPEQFIPIAEETGLIGPLSEWVLKKACRAAWNWPGKFIAVNLSPVQFRAAGFAARTIALVREAGIDPDRIELEVTEGVLLADDELVRAALRDLRAAGFRIALDDFGTGYSSFNYLRRFAVDKIKIDRSFVQHVGQRRDSATIVAAVVAIGRAIGVTVAAEGVETQEQLRFLSAAGCDQMQGFLFSPALPEEEVDAFLAAQAGGSCRLAVPAREAYSQRASVRA